MQRSARMTGGSGGSGGGGTSTPDSLESYEAFRRRLQADLAAAQSLCQDLMEEERSYRELESNIAVLQRVRRAGGTRPCRRAGGWFGMDNLQRSSHRIDEVLPLLPGLYAIAAQRPPPSPPLPTPKLVKVGSLTTLVPLGAGVHAQAAVPDTSRLFVHVALGFHPELTLEEAAAAAAARRRHLQTQLARRGAEAAAIMAHLRLMSRA